MPPKRPSAHLPWSGWRLVHGPLTRRLCQKSRANNVTDWPWPEDLVVQKGVRTSNSHPGKAPNFSPSDEVSLTNASWTPRTPGIHDPMSICFGNGERRVSPGKEKLLRILWWRHAHAVDKRQNFSQRLGSCYRRQLQKLRTSSMSKLLMYTVKNNRQWKMIQVWCFFVSFLCFFVSFLCLFCVFLVSFCVFFVSFWCLCVSFFVSFCVFLYLFCVFLWFDSFFQSCFTFIWGKIPKV